MKEMALKIMMLEDNQDDIILMNKRLEQIKVQCQLRVYSKSQDALDFFDAVTSGQGQHESMPHLIFLDLGLPDEHGLEVLKKAKSMPRLQNIPVVVISASEATEDFKQTYKLGGAMYLKKPWEPEALKEIIFQLKISGRV